MAPLLASDAASPRLTTYTDAGRMELSAETVANWAAKGGNLMIGELGLGPGDVVAVDAPADWMPAVLVLGCWRAGVAVCSPDSPAFDAAATLLTTDADAHPDFGGEVLLLSTDPFGRGVAESGGQLPPGAIDFGPTVRFYGDDYFGQTTPLPELYPDSGSASRLLSTGWHDKDTFTTGVLHPLAAGGSAVVVSGLTTTERLQKIAENENTTARL